jgi:hypothetical protein
MLVQQPGLADEGALDRGQVGIGDEGLQFLHAHHTVFGR